MIALFSSRRKVRRQAEDWIRLARKVEDYRRDILPPDDLSALQKARAELESLHKDKATPSDQLKKAWERLDAPLKRCGGSFYPRTFWAENVEMLLVAAIIVIGIRSFFIQPFKIPTNSMYPTYNGMTAVIHQEPDAAPGQIARVARFLSFGASRHELVAPVSGDLAFSPVPRAVPGRRFGFFPTTLARYTFYVDREAIHLDVPMDFDMSPIFSAFLENGREPGMLSDGTRVWRNGQRVERGETFLSFDLMTGDQLFVDRMSYHFVRPKMGDPFVFRTDNIENMSPDHRGKYYIKRVAGTPGDRIEIDPPALLRNGEPAEGARAFAFNAAQEGRYPGYVTVSDSRAIASGVRPIDIPQNHYFALGDNSPNSLDSRMWGFVPEGEIVGRAIFIYYPFTSRWGISR